MRKFLILFIMVMLSTAGAFAQAELDPAYVKTFGNGIVLVSQSGFPLMAKYDKAQFDYRDGKFFIPSGPEAELQVRAILFKGMTLGEELKKLKKEQAENLKYHQKDYCAFKVWSTHDEGGNALENVKWPASIKDEPQWAEPKVGFSDLSEEVYGWFAPGVKYEGDFRSSFWSIMPASAPGQKLYITFHVCFEYQVPGGQVESKWNSVLERFENVTSNGMIGYAYSAPLAVSTVEFK